jgi:hypothetical protein
MTTPHLHRGELLETLKTTMWFDAETKQLIVNGHADAGLESYQVGGMPGTVNVLTLAGTSLHGGLLKRSPMMRPV